MFTSQQVHAYLSVKKLCLQTTVTVRLFNDLAAGNMLEESWADSIQWYGVILSTQYRERFWDLPSLLVSRPQYQGSRNVIPNNHINI